MVSRLPSSARWSPLVTAAPRTQQVSGRVTQAAGRDVVWVTLLLGAVWSCGWWEGKDGKYELKPVEKRGWDCAAGRGGESVSPAPSTASGLIMWDEWMWNCGPGSALSGWATLMWCLMCSKYNQELRMQLFFNWLLCYLLTIRDTINTKQEW